MKITKSKLLGRIEALEKENKQRGIGNAFMSLKCIQGNRTFTKDVTYAASKTFDSIVITNNFGSVKILEENTNIFGGYKVTHDTQTAVFQVIGADVEPEPKLKQLDQSVFDGQSKEWRFAGVDGNGEARLHTRTTYSNGYILRNVHGSNKLIGKGYDTSDWQNSLIERDKVELTGSDLCRAMLARGDTRIMCKVYDVDRQHDITHVIRAYRDGKFHTKANRWDNAVPINNQGEPLTQSEVGL